MKPIDKPDLDNTDPLYWERVLRSHGLSTTKGEYPRERQKQSDGTIKKISRVLQVGNMRNVDSVEEEQVRIKTGVVKPEGHGPDR